MKIRIVLAAAAASAGLAAANIIKVTTTTDERGVKNTACSLYEAIKVANREHTSTDWGCALPDGSALSIQLDAKTYHYAATLEPYKGILVKRSVEIFGAGMGKTFVRCDGPSIFEIARDNQPTVTLRDMTLKYTVEADDQTGIIVDAFDMSKTARLNLKSMVIQGFPGAGIVNNGGIVSIDRSAIVDNESESPGGGIENNGVTPPGGGTLTITNSLIANNTTTRQGGGIANYGRLTMTNSTVSNNVAFETGSDTYVGGGIHTSDATTTAGGQASMTLNHVTVSLNYADLLGGGIRVDDAPGLKVSVSNCIFAYNESSSDPDFSGLTGSDEIGNGPNLFSTSEGSMSLKDDDLLDVDPLLGFFGANGGPFDSHPLQKGSPAIDIANSSLTTDVRGLTRPIDGNGDGVKKNDLGACEFDPKTQTEILPLIKATDAYAVVTSSSYSNGKATRLSSNATGDYVKITVPVSEPGTYAISVREHKGTDRGKFQLKVLDDNTGSMVNVGSAKDEYASSSSLSEVSIGTKSFSFRGSKTFQFQVTGKNSASSNYRLYFDYIKLVKQ
jgi:CSLREA domain-containing protein